MFIDKQYISLSYNTKTECSYKVKFREFTRIIFASLQEVIIFYINIYMIIQIYSYEIRVQSPNTKHPHGFFKKI